MTHEDLMHLELAGENHIPLAPVLVDRNRFVAVTKTYNKIRGNGFNRRVAGAEAWRTSFQHTRDSARGIIFKK